MFYSYLSQHCEWLGNNMSCFTRTPASIVNGVWGGDILDHGSKSNTYVFLVTHVVLWLYISGHAGRVWFKPNDHLTHWQVLKQTQWPPCTLAVLNQTQCPPGTLAGSESNPMLRGGKIGQEDDDYCCSTAWLLCNNTKALIKNKKAHTLFTKALLNEHNSFQLC